MRPLINAAFAVQCDQLVDSQLESTRIFWRQRHFNATGAEARDPRPWIVVLSERIA